MKYIDLFSGAGGLSLGFKRAGARLLFANEFDKYACETYRKNIENFGDDPNKLIEGSIEKLHELLFLKNNIEIDFGETFNNDVNVLYYKKAKRLDKKQLEFIDTHSEVDFIIGGPPCQGFSNAGRGKKSAILNNYKDYIDDPRNHLFKYFLGFVSKFNPKVVLIENVKGLSSSSDYRNIIQDSLENTGAGYITLSKIINAANFGVPQSRERIFFIGVRNDLKNADEFIFYLNNILTYYKEKIITTRDAIDDLPKISHNPKPNNTDIESEIPIGDKGSFGENISSKPYSDLILTKTQYAKDINRFKGEVIKPEKLYNHKTRYNNLDDLKIYKLMKPGKYINHEDNYEALKLCKYGTEEKNGKVIINNFADKYFKLHPDKPSRTIVAHLKNDNNGFIHYGPTSRGISVREAARLQSFPDWYKFEGPLSYQFKQIGNAVPPILSYKLAMILKSFLEDGLDILLEKYEAKELF